MDLRVRSHQNFAFNAYFLQVCYSYIKLRLYLAFSTKSTIVKLLQGVCMNQPRFHTSREYDRQFLILDQNNDVVVNDDGEPLVGSPLDERSHTLRHFGKWSLSAEAGIGLMQLADPEIGAAVDHTGKFWRNPYKRIAVSMEPILAVVYADDPYSAGDRVRQFHEGIHGTDHKGRRFNALSKDAFYWAHNTFQYATETSATKYSPKRMSLEDMDQLQRESTAWYSYYGMPMGMVPVDWEANVAYRSDYIANKLEMTPALERALEMAVGRNAPPIDAVPKVIWDLAKIGIAPVMEIMSTLTVGELPKEFRDKFGIPFSHTDEIKLQAIRTAGKFVMPRLPAPAQYSPQAYDGILREYGGHRNLVDKVTHTGLTMGRAAIERVTRSVA